MGYRLEARPYPPGRFCGVLVRVSPRTQPARCAGCACIRSARTPVNYILDCDVRSFFDSVSHDWLVRFVEHRIGDPRVIRLIRKWLKAGVMEDDTWSATESGTPQGSVVSPTLANVRSEERRVGKDRTRSQEP